MSSTPREPATAGNGETKVAPLKSYRCIHVCILVTFVFSYICLNLIPYRLNIAPINKRNKTPSNSIESSFKFPKQLHQLWRDRSSQLSPDLALWLNNCQEVNADYVSNFYYDADIQEFIEKSYPEYLPMFNSLYFGSRRLTKSALDMARILIAYHYGGIYMAVDYYCHRPFTCLEDIVAQELQDYKSSNLLLVGREPMALSLLTQNKDRTVGAEWLMSTKKHPFFKWLLDDRKKVYEEEKDKPKTKANKLQKQQKGPFSATIEHDIDRYRAAVIKEMAKDTDLEELIDSNFFLTAGEIFELPEGVLHPLIDSTNKKLYATCEKVGKDAQENIKSACDNLYRGNVFNPAAETIAVHMWAKPGFMDWFSIDTMYRTITFNKVEQKLPPTLVCPKVKTKYFEGAIDNTDWGR